MPCILACNSHSKKHADKFYDTISEDWDYICIPIVKPYKAASTDNGRSWLLEFEMPNEVKVSSFGVSKNFIYGYGDEVIIDGQPKKGWFAFDIHSKLLAVYSSRKDLTSSLNEFNISVNNIADCNKYMDSLANGHDLSWYPKIEKNYPSFPEIHPKKEEEIKVTEDVNGKLDFYFNPVLPLSKSGIYSFKISYNKKQNDLYYLLLPGRNPILVKDNLTIPVFIDTNKLDLYLYTPVPVAEEKKIPKSERFEKIKPLSVQ
jgi:hypothetical protein